MQNQAYTSPVRPILLYASCVRDPYQRKHIRQLESMQQHAARLTTGNYYSFIPGCVTNMVTQLGWDLLQHRRAKHTMAVLDKIINNFANIPVHQHLKVHDRRTHGSVSHKFRQLNTKLNGHKFSFIPATIVSRNTLPLEVRQLPSLEQLQHALSQITIESMICDS